MKTCRAAVCGRQFRSHAPRRIYGASRCRGPIRAAGVYFIGRVRPAHIHGLRVSRQLDLAETSLQESEWTFLRVADHPLVAVSRVFFPTDSEIPTISPKRSFISCFGLLQLCVLY
jgi:hypothetical protein